MCVAEVRAEGHVPLRRFGHYCPRLRSYLVVGYLVVSYPGSRLVGIRTVWLKWGPWVRADGKCGCEFHVWNHRLRG